MSVCQLNIMFKFQSPSTVVGRGSDFQLWKAGYYTVVHFAGQDLTVLWDRKTTVHVRAGPQWKVCSRLNMNFFFF